MPAEFAAFHFLRPAWGLLLIPTGLLLWHLWRQPGEQQRFAHIISSHLLAHLRVGRSRSRWFNPRTMTCLLMVLIALVVMGPTWRQQASPLQRDEATLVLLLDASESMSQRDVQPSRLERAKQKIGDLLALSPDKKAALIVYAGSAHTVLSMTADRDILTRYLDAIRPAIMPRSGKFPEYALPRVDAVLREQHGPATVVLLADGLGGDSEAAFRDYFNRRAHQLLVLGIGSDEPGEQGIPLERDALRELAAAAGGRYFDLSVDDTDVRRIDRASGSFYIPTDNEALPWVDSGYVLIFPTMAIFLLWFRRGWTLSWIWLLAPVLLMPAPPLSAAGNSGAGDTGADPHWFADLWLSPDQQGRLLMQRGAYREAAQRFRDPLWKALAHYYAEDFMQAAEYYSRSDSDSALFNEANARAHARDYLRALRRYDRLLARNPDFPGARANRDAVQALVDEINRMSESQQAEAGEDSTELGADDPRAAEGADQTVWKEAEVQQLSAEEVLGSEATREMWLRGVQQDPSNFLAIKFSMQLEQSADSGAGPDPVPKHDP